ncbi:MAG: SMI1/KNR4 family protein [Ruminococcus sp.]|uniref:SMI1/KNR4 family protein n=1 Tax=Ruminococcus sp. TaxID=41978 RepID=UPI0025E38BB5|nr:SMI1/KNR4 family protein [Ruminococcus sp.]MCR5601716.1 SMI1/KNR4 family protein [Ruminococcus sp.]
MTDRPDEELISAYLPVNSEERAKNIFFIFEGNYYKIRDMLSAEELAAYESYSPRKWAAELCRLWLEPMICGNTSNYPELFSKFCGTAEYYISTDTDGLADAFSKAWLQVLQKEAVPVRVGCIERYMELLNGRLAHNIPQVLPVLEKTEEYLLKHTPEDYNRDQYHSLSGKFRVLLSQIRCTYAEMSAPCDSDFRFVLTEQSWLDIIRDSIMEKWDSSDVVLEFTSGLNCACGVRNDGIFLTAGSEAADSGSIRSFDTVSFYAVFIDKGKAAYFDVKLNDKGRYTVQQVHLNNELIRDHTAEIEDAIALYRNFQAKREFQASQGFDSWFNYQSDCSEKFRAQFPKLMADIYERINDDSKLHDILTELVDCAEYIAPDYNVTFGTPATEEDIKACEEKFGIKLSEDYCELMRFANGFSFGYSTEIYSLGSIGREKEWFDNDGFEGYIDIGSIIGDGTLICLDPDGNGFSEWQDGEMSSIGDLNDLIKTICRLNS